MPTRRTRPPAGGPAGGQKPFQLQLRGPDAVVLTRLADSVAAIVRRTPGAVDVGLSTKGQKPELDVQLFCDALCNGARGQTAR